MKRRCILFCALRHLREVGHAISAHGKPSAQAQRFIDVRARILSRLLGV